MFSKVIIITRTFWSIAQGRIFPMNRQTRFTPSIFPIGTGTLLFVTTILVQFNLLALDQNSNKVSNHQIMNFFFLLYFRFLFLSSQQQWRLLLLRERTTRRRRWFSLFLMTILVFYNLNYSGVSVVFAVLLVVIIYSIAQRRRVLFPYPLFSKITLMYHTSIFYSGAS